MKTNLLVVAALAWTTGLAATVLLCLYPRPLAAAGDSDRVTIYPAPAGEPLSAEYQVSVGGESVPVYIARVAPADEQRRWKAMDDKANSAEFYDTAAFASFDMRSSATMAVAVIVTVPREVTSARILPSKLGIKPRIQGKSITFEIAKPCQLTIEINGEWVKSLHVFVNPPETDAPRADDPNVVYFGPGIHETGHLVVGDNKTVYVAGGAVVRTIIQPDEKSWISSYSGLKNYAPSIELKGKNIRLRGRGIIDATGCTTHARNMVYVNGSDITLEGVVLRDSSTWTVPIRRSDRVTVRNVKLLGYRANSDGIDICNSRDVTVEDCFIRTLDDLIVVKSDKGQGAVQRVVGRRCVLWNQVAHGLSVGAELADPVDDVLFTDCDIIHDQGREWSLRVYHCDAAPVTNIRFEDIRIEEARKCISLWIGKAVWTRDPERGVIRNVLFRNVAAAGKDLKVELVGADEAHAVEDVRFENVTLNGLPLNCGQVQTNAAVRGVTVSP